MLGKRPHVTLVSWAFPARAEVAGRGHRGGRNLGAGELARVPTGGPQGARVAVWRGHGLGPALPG